MYETFLTRRSSCFEVYFLSTPYEALHCSEGKKRAVHREAPFQFMCSRELNPFPRCRGFAFYLCQGDILWKLGSRRRI